MFDSTLIHHHGSYLRCLGMPRGAHRAGLCFRRHAGRPRGHTGGYDVILHREHGCVPARRVNRPQHFENDGEPCVSPIIANLGERMKRV